MRLTENDLDILFRNFYNHDGSYQPITAKLGYPTDIYEDPNGLNIDVACTSISKKDIEVTTQQNVIKIKYTKPAEEKLEEDNIKYYHKGISSKSFDLGFKISPRFNISELEATFTNGLLSIFIPLQESSKPKSITIR
jgi:HSP20 family protein